MKLTKYLIAAFLLIFAVPTISVAAGMDLTTAKTQGLVGEIYDGYIGAVFPSPEVNELVQSVNSGRLKSYNEIAAKRGIPVQEVQKLAGVTLIEQTPAGQYVKLPGTDWKKK